MTPLTTISAVLEKPPAGYPKFREPGRRLGVSSLEPNDFEATLRAAFAQDRDAVRGRDVEGSRRDAAKLLEGAPTGAQMLAAANRARGRGHHHLADVLMREAKAWRERNQRRAQ